MSLGAPAALPDVVLSLIPHHADHAIGEVLPLSWPEFVAQFATARPRTVPKGALPLWSPASYRDAYVEDANVEGVYALVYDVDKSPVPDQDTLKRKLAGMRAVVSSSSRATALAPRWRLALAVSRPILPAEYLRVWTGVAAVRLGFPVGKEAKNCGRAWYVPREGEDGTYTTFAVDGEPLDVDDILSWAPPAPDAAPTMPAAAAPGTHRDTAAALLAAHWPPAGARLDARLALMGACWHAGYSEDSAAALAKTVHSLLPDRGDATDDVLDDLAASTYARGKAGKPVAGWPKLAEHVDAAIVTAARGLVEGDPDLEAFCMRGEEGETGAPRVTSTAAVDPDAPIHFEDAVLPLFPVHVLPPVLRDFALAQAEFTQVAVDLPAALALGACSAAVSGRVELEVQPGYVEPLNLYVVCALPTGDRKTPNFEEALAPLKEVERLKRAQSEIEITKLRAKRTTIEHTLKKRQSEYAGLRRNEVNQEWTTAGATPGGAAILREIDSLAEQVARMSPPAPVQLLAEDVTPERIASLLADQDGVLCLASDEGGLFDNIAGRYAKDGKSNFDILLKAYSGSSYKNDRQAADRKPIAISRPLLTLILSPQPSVVETLGTKSMRSKGLLARFLYSLPRSRVGQRATRTRAVPSEVRAAYSMAVSRLAMLPTPRERAVSSADTPRIELAPEALDLHLEFRDQLEPRLAPGGDLHDLVDWANKWAGNIARIAGVLHCVENGPTGQVSADAMDRALEVGRYFLAHALAAFGLMSDGAASQDARDIWRWLLTGGRQRVTLKDLRRLAPRSVRGDKARLSVAMAELVDRGLVRVDGAVWEIVATATAAATR